jgi:broad specificity phosphatase PhoE
MTRIIIARHGETDWNVGEVFRGRLDVGLNETGLAQAEALGQHLAGMNVEAVYSSPLKRALDTARSVAVHHDLEVSVAQGLVDFNYGAWQGLTHQEVKERYAELYRRWLAEPHLVTMPDGESLDDVAERARHVVENVADSHKGTVVLVSHRVVNKVLTCSLLGLDNSHFWNIRQDVTGTTIFEYEDGLFILTRHNDTSHLGQAQNHALSDF